MVIDRLPTQIGGEPLVLVTLVSEIHMLTAYLSTSAYVYGWRAQLIKPGSCKSTINGGKNFLLGTNIQHHPTRKQIGGISSSIDDTGHRGSHVFSSAAKSIPILACFDAENLSILVYPMVYIYMVYPHENPWKSLFSTVFHPQVSTWRFNFLFDPQKDFFAQAPGMIGCSLDSSAGKRSDRWRQ